MEQQSRGICCQHPLNHTYLLDMQWVLDARVRGNKLRFANHSTQPNCKVGMSAMKAAG